MIIDSVFEKKDQSKLLGFDDVILRPHEESYYGSSEHKNLPSRSRLANIARDQFALVNAPMTVFRPEGIETLLNNPHIPFVFLPRIDYWNLREYYPDWDLPNVRLDFIQSFYSKNIKNLHKLIPSISLRDISVEDGLSVEFHTLYNPHSKLCLIDVAYPITNRHMESLDVFEEKHLNNYPTWFITGNVGSVRQAYNLCNYHNNDDSGKTLNGKKPQKIIKGVRIGIGSGSACSTKINTASGTGIISSFCFPQSFSTELENVWLIADGGIRHSGDYIKSVAVGAHMVMSGKMIAKCSDVATFDDYIGLASQRNRIESTVKAVNNSIEGVHFQLNKEDKTLQEMIDGICENMATAMVMQCAKDIETFQKNARRNLIEIGNGTLRESYPNPT
jgi:IMP dehydrogenase/GMP reductase